MDNNFIRDIPPELFKHVDLHILSLSNNLLQIIPDEISSQKNLLYLDISINRIEEISSAGLCQLSKLKCLIINNNEFRYLPYELENLVELKEIKLDWFKYCQPAYDLKINQEHIIKQFIQMFPLLKEKISQKSLFNSEESEYYNCEDATRGITFIQFVEYFSQNKFNINYRDHNGRTLAHLSSINEDIGALVSILEQDYDLINSLDFEMNSPLSIAILQEKFFSSKTLITNGAKINIGGGYYGSCLNITVIKQQLYLVQDILKRGGDPNQCDDEGNSALHYIMSIYDKDAKLSEKICQLLLRYGANPNLKNKEKWCPCHLAAKKGQLAAIQFILRYNKHIAGNDSKWKKFNLNKKGGKDDYTALHLSSYHGYQDIVQELLESDVDIFSRTLNNKSAADLSNRDTYLAKLVTLKEQQYIRKNIIQKLDDPVLIQYNNNTHNKAQNPQQQFIKDNNNNSQSKLFNKENIISHPAIDKSIVGRSIGSLQGMKKNQQVIKYSQGNSYNSMDFTYLEEESFDDEDMDENKEIQELMSTKINIVNRQLTYVPNNIQQIEQFYKIKQISGNKQQNQLDTSVSEFSHQYVSQIKHLITKTINIIDYYSSSLEKFSQGIESNLHNLNEKLKYLIIMVKLHIEFEQMVNLVNYEKNKIMKHNLNLCDEFIMKDNLAQNIIMDQWISMLEKMKENKDYAISKIKEMIFYLFGHNVYMKSLELMQEQINFAPNYVSFEAAQSIYKIKSTLYIDQNIRDQQGSDQKMKGLQQKALLTTFPNISEPSVPNLTCRTQTEDEVYQQLQLKTNINSCNITLNNPNLSWLSQEPENQNNSNNVSYHSNHTSSSIHKKYQQQDILAQNTQINMKKMKDIGKNTNQNYKINNQIISEADENLDCSDDIGIKTAFNNLQVVQKDKKQEEARDF